MSDTLKKYSKKRDFSKTNEPKPDLKKNTKKSHIFVVQKHSARSLHYDFRLEIDGVLKSWAVPKGPSTDPKEIRLAVPTEDHPMDYANFSGTIPAGQYGAGEVEIWDHGTYTNIKPGTIEKSLKSGKIEINLKGKKLKGSYVLIRTNFMGKESWLLKKMAN